MSDSTRGAPTRRPPLLGPFGRKAVRVGRLLNIEIGFDLSWLFILVLVTVGLAEKFRIEHEQWSALQSWGTGFVTSLAFFLSILLHELGHSVTSNALGLPVRSITLFVFGGLAKLSGKPKTPRDEFLIGLAGPAVSLALGGLFLGMAALVPSVPGVGELAAAAFSWLGFVNIVLAAFNLFPGYPLDGGHLLRAVVWAVTGSEFRGTALASALGTAFALSLIGFGAMSILLLRSIGGFWLVLIGWFVMRASQSSVLQELLEDRLSRVTSRETLADDCPRVDADETVESLIAGAILQKGQRCFCVEEQGEFKGLVTLSDVKSISAHERATTSLASIMVPLEHLATISGDETLWDAMRTMDDRGVNQLPVMHEGRLIGLLTREHLLRVIRNQMDLGRGREAGLLTPTHFGER